MPCYAEEVSESIVPSYKIYIFIHCISTSREVLVRSFDALASSAYSRDRQLTPCYVPAGTIVTYMFFFPPGSICRPQN